MVGRVNVDDYELKVRKLTRHSKHRKKLTDKATMTKGKFLFIPTDELIQFPRFTQKGKPHEIKPRLRQKMHTTLAPTQPKKRKSIIKKIKNFLDLITLKSYFRRIEEGCRGANGIISTQETDDDEIEEEEDAILFLDEDQ